MRRSGIASALLAALLLAAGCAGKAATADARRSGATSDYERAVRAAERPGEAKVFDDLVAITERDPRLSWSGDPSRRRVLVVTWTRWPGFRDALGTGAPVTLGRDAWVTAVPEVRELCRAFRGTRAELALRLEQYLGLPPASGLTYFAELWVDPGDLARACPDPEIDDRRCDLTFPASASAAHREWFERQRESSFAGEVRYPWTQLGYTFDWGNPHSEVGASEFVVRKGAIVVPRAAVDTAEYCRPAAPVEAR